MSIPVDDKTLLKLNEKGKSYAELAGLFDMTRGQIAGRIHRYKNHLANKAPKPAREWFEISYGKPLSLDGDWMIVGDVHVPSTDYDFAQLVVEVAKKYNIKKLLVAGDLYNLDHFSLYPKLVDLATWEQEKFAARVLLKEWIEHFTEIVFLMGNHERRLERLTDGALRETDIFVDLILHGRGLVTVSNFGWAEIQSPTGVWRVTHPRNYSINQLTVADQLAQKYRSHIIAHHEHHLAIGWDRYKNNIIVNNGGLFDPKKFAYVNLDDSKSAGMTPGFTMLRGGYPTLYGREPFTNWTEVLGSSV